MGCPSASDFEETREKMLKYEDLMDEVSDEIAPLIVDIVRAIGKPVPYIDMWLYLTLKLDGNWDLAHLALNKTIWGPQKGLYHTKDDNLLAIET